MRMGPITTDIIKNGLIFNMDPANRASYVPDATTSYNTTDLLISGSLENSINFVGSPASWGFDGVGDLIDCNIGNSDIFSFGDASNDFPFSTSLWVNFSSTSGTQGLITKDNGTYREWAVILIGGEFRIFIKDAPGMSNQQSIDSQTTPSTSTWYHVTTTYNGVGGSNAADGLKFYINGIFESPANVVKQTYQAMDATAAPVRLGKGYTSYQFYGNIANAQIYNRELSSTEVLHNYNALKSRFE